MKNVILLLSLLISAPIFGQSNQSKPSAGNTIEVTIKNVKSNSGKVFIALHNKKEDFLKKEYKEIVVVPENGKDIIVKFSNLPNGEYTVSVVHDINNNKELDTNFMGIPSEPYGISMTGKNKYGPPSYDNAKFQIENKDQTLIISL